MIYVANMITILSYQYDSLVETLSPVNSLKLKYHPWQNVADLCDVILIDSERLEIDGAFNPEHLGYIIHIFEDTYDYIFHLWTTEKYKEVMDFIKKP